MIVKPQYKKYIPPLEKVSIELNVDEARQLKAAMCYCYYTLKGVTPDKFCRDLYGLLVRIVPLQ